MARNLSMIISMLQKYLLQKMERKERQAWNRYSNKMVVIHTFSYFKKYWYFFLPVTILFILLYSISIPIIEYNMQKAIVAFLIIVEISLLIQFSAFPRKLAIWKNYLQNSKDFNFPLDQLKEIVPDDEQVFLLTHFTIQLMRVKNKLNLDNAKKIMILKHLLPQEDFIKFSKIEKENAHPAMKILGILIAITGLPSLILMIMFGIIQIGDMFTEFLFVAKGIIFVVPPLIIFIIISTLLGLKTYDANLNWIQFLIQTQFEDSNRIFQGYLLYSNDKENDEITQYQVLEYAQKYIKIAYNSTDFDILA